MYFHGWDIRRREYRKVGSTDETAHGLAELERALQSIQKVNKELRATCQEHLAAPSAPGHGSLWVAQHFHSERRATLHRVEYAIRNTARSIAMVQKMRKQGTT
jgi:3-methyladenine DNA glycosylase Tag